MADKQAQITIVGLGLIGTSLGLALRGADTNFKVVGHDREIETAKQATRLGAIDEAMWNLINAVENADLIFLAIPAAGVRDTFRAIADHLKPGVVITDTASTKEQIMDWAGELLPDHVNFVGGNPIVKRMRHGQEGATANLFQDTVYCLVPAMNADGESIAVVERLVSSLGAEPYFPNAAEHDGLIAGIAHLPFVLSAGLIRAAAQSSSDQDLKRMAGQEYRRFTEFPSTDPAVFSDVCLTNGDNIVRWIDRMIVELREWRDIISDQDEEQLEDLFVELLITRDRWLGDVETPSQMEKTLDEVGTGFRDMLFGSLTRRRGRD